MKATGRGALLAVCCGLWLCASPVLAAVNASLDRTQAVLGDSLRLTLTATEDEELSEVDLTPLLTDFEILRRSTSSQTRFINGQRSHTKQLLVDLAPKTEGELLIPGLRVGNALTNALRLSVGPPPEMDSADSAVLFEAEVDRDSVYVQGQLILTLRVLQAINLDGRSISELEMDNAFVKPLEQSSFQRNIKGRKWLVHELRYAIFPEQSGTLEIPSQVFSGREATGRRNLFDFGGGGRVVRRVSPALQVEVLPRPADYPAGTWLPARKVTLEEHWSSPPEQLRAGESSTRTIHIKGEGLQGAQLPPMQFTQADGVKFYPDQPDVRESEISTGLVSSRRDSAAIVPTREGAVTLPEIRVPWWDTESGALRYATLPSRTFAVAAASPGASAAPEVPAVPATTPVAAAAPSQESALPWRVLAIASTLGWLLTLAYLWFTRGRAGAASPARGDEPGTVSERRAFRELERDCAGADAAKVRGAVIRWAQALAGDPGIVSLDKVCALFDDPVLSGRLNALDHSLYSTSSSSWNGRELKSALQAARASFLAHARTSSQGLQLYPRAA